MLNLNATVISPNTVTPDYTNPLHKKYIEEVPSTIKAGLKAAIFGVAALVGTGATYCASRYFVDSNSINAVALSTFARSGLDISRGMVSTRAIPIAWPLGDQEAVAGTSFQVSHQFFTEAGGGFVQPKIIHGPSWLSLQLDPVVSSYDTTGGGWGIQIVGTTAYVGDGISGLQIINIATPSNPILIGNFDTPGEAWGVQVIGTTAYVADLTSGLQIIKITTPSNPTLIGTYNTPGKAMQVQVVGTTAYVADGASGLQIIKITTPSSPTLLGTYPTPSNANGVQVIGTTAYVAGGTSGLLIINVATPSSPTLIGSCSTPGVAIQVQVVGTTAYVTNGDRGLQIINIATPSSPILIGGCNTPGYAQGLQIVGTIAYVADIGGLQIISVAAPSNPTLIGSYYDTSGGSFVGVQVVGTTAYIAYDRCLQILNGLNQLKLLGTPATSDRGNYYVSLVGTTTAGVGFVDFNLNVVASAPIYKNPMSLKATAGEKFDYPMPDNTFVDPNGNTMTYNVKDLPQWLMFDAGKRTFSGKPTPGDTNTYAEKQTIATIVASNGQLETAGQFAVTVDGDSYLAQLIKYGLSTSGGVGVVYALCKKLWNWRVERKWKNNQASAKLGENFMYELKTNAKNVRKIQVYVEDTGFFGKIYAQILCGKKRQVALVSDLPVWMGYNSEVNTLHSIRRLEPVDLMSQREMKIRVLGFAGLIKEVVTIELKGEALTLDGSFNSVERQEQIGLLLFSSNIEMQSMGSSNKDGAYDPSEASTTRASAGSSV